MGWIKKPDFHSKPGGTGLWNEKTRYRGLAKTHLQNLAIAAAINIERAVNWLLAIKQEKTAVPRFAALALPSS